uniref:Uncharacterized protein n=1 Tax=Clytia hemisphaerica TaxID=252671 RepID=A0A7M5V807_9CNID
TNLHERYGNTPKKYSPSMNTFTNCRDAILLILVVPNISRAGAVANMTLEEYKKATVTATGKSSILVKKHKTAKDYGPAEVLIRPENKVLLDTYVNVIRANVPGQKDPAVFIHWTGTQFDATGGISIQLYSILKKCIPEVFQGDKKASCTIIRKSLVTFFYKEFPEMKEKLSKLMKHKVETAEKFYNTNRMRAECDQTFDLVEKHLFGDFNNYLCEEEKRKAGESQSRKHENETEIATDDDDPEDPDYIDDSFSRPRPIALWDDESEKELIDVFGDQNYESWSMPIIGLKKSESNILKKFGSKQIYDKLRKLKATGKLGGEKADEVPSKKAKFSFSTEQTLMIRDMFKGLINGRGSVVATDVIVEFKTKPAISRALFEGIDDEAIVNKLVEIC